jgi:hypothetical protein
MINEKKVKLMTKMALYDTYEGKKDILLNEYYRKDYVSYHVITTILWVTLGYILCWGLWGMISYEKLISELNMKFLITLGIGALLGYIAVILLFGIIAYGLYEKRHNDAQKRIKKYKRNMLRLKKV